MAELKQCTRIRDVLQDVDQHNPIEDGQQFQLLDPLHGSQPTLLQLFTPARAVIETDRLDARAREYFQQRAVAASEIQDSKSLLTRLRRHQLSA